MNCGCTPENGNRAQSLRANVRAGAAQESTHTPPPLLDDSNKGTPFCTKSPLRHHCIESGTLPSFFAAA